jgi:hypothetical protein
MFRAIWLAIQDVCSINRYPKRDGQQVASAVTESEEGLSIG